MRVTRRQAVAGAVGSAVASKTAGARASPASTADAVVVGAGAMGSGIAAHLANGGVRVRLLDVVPKGESGHRSRLARDAITRQVKAGGFMLPVFADRVTAGNIVDDVDAYGQADWVIAVPPRCPTSPPYAAQPSAAAPSYPMKDLIG